MHDAERPSQELLLYMDTANCLSFIKYAALVDCMCYSIFAMQYAYTFIRRRGALNYSYAEK